MWGLRDIIIIPNAVWLNFELKMELLKDGGEELQVNLQQHGLEDGKCRRAIVSSCSSLYITSDRRRAIATVTC